MIRFITTSVESLDCSQYGVWMFLKNEKIMLVNIGLWCPSAAFSRECGGSTKRTDEIQKLFEMDMGLY